MTTCIFQFEQPNLCVICCICFHVSLPLSLQLPPCSFRPSAIILGVARVAPFARNEVLHRNFKLGFLTIDVPEKPLLGLVHGMLEAFEIMVAQQH